MFDLASRVHPNELADMNLLASSTHLSQLAVPPHADVAFRFYVAMRKTCAFSHSTIVPTFDLSWSKGEEYAWIILRSGGSSLMMWNNPTSWRKIKTPYSNMTTPPHHLEFHHVFHMSLSWQNKLGLALLEELTATYFLAGRHVANGEGHQFFVGAIVPSGNAFIFHLSLSLINVLRTHHATWQWDANLLWKTLAKSWWCDSAHRRCMKFSSPPLL